MIKFKVDGYDFSERMLEGLLFEVEVDPTTRQITSFGLSAETLRANKNYLQGIYMEYWIATGTVSTQDVVDRIYESGQAQEIFAALNDDGTLEF